MNHGRSRYVKGCRCEICREGQRTYMREYLRRKSQGRPREVVACEHCGAGFERVCGNTVKRFCSRRCQGASLRPTPTSQFRKRAKRDAAKAARGTSSSWTWVQGTCDECGEYFVRHGAASSYCSGPCRRHAVSRARRALKAGMKVTKARKFRIHERDNWTCHICGDPVNRDATVPALDAPTLDHVVALASGGAHDESNLKTAHFYCNSVKRELPLSEVA